MLRLLPTFKNFVHSDPVWYYNKARFLPSSLYLLRLNICYCDLRSSLRRAVPKRTFAVSKLSYSSSVHRLLLQYNKVLLDSCNIFRHEWLKCCPHTRKFGRSNLSLVSTARSFVAGISKQWPVPGSEIFEF